MLPNCLVKYVVDSSPERRTFVETNFPRTSAIDSYDQVLGDPEVDGVIIATPAISHFKLTMLALQARNSMRLSKKTARNESG